MRQKCWAPRGRLPRALTPSASTSMSDAFIWVWDTQDFSKWVDSTWGGRGSRMVHAGCVWQQGPV